MQYEYDFSFPQSYTHCFLEYELKSPNMHVIVSYSNSVVKLKNLNFKKIKYSNINKIFFEQINLPRNLNRIHVILLQIHLKSCFSGFLY